MELRDAYFQGLYDRASRDKRVIVLTGDHGATWLSQLAKDFPNQYINCGIAEQNMMSVALGLALCGKLPFVYAINPFLVLRAFEQITAIAKAKVPVTLVGVGAGYTYSTDGPTHHGVTDLGVMMQLPCEIFNLSDSHISQSMAHYESKGLVYMRIGRGQTPRWHTGPYKDGLTVLAEGDRKIITSGHMVHECINSGLGVIDLYRVKPINGALLKKVAGENPLVVEDNLGAPIHKAVSAIIGKCESIAPKDFLHEYGSREFLHKKAGIDKETIERSARCPLLHTPISKRQSQAG